MTEKPYFEHNETMQEVTLQGDVILSNTRVLLRKTRSTDQNDS